MRLAPRSILRRDVRCSRPDIALILLFARSKDCLKSANCDH